MHGAAGDSRSSGQETRMKVHYRAHKSQILRHFKTLRIVLL